MEISSDYEELFKTLNEFKVRYLVIGAYAVIYHSEPRYTKDMDVWIIPELNDPTNVFNALAAFGAPLTKLSPKDFTDKKMILQIGVPPVRIDILIDIEGVSFEKAWKRRKKYRYGNAAINILGIEDLIKSKIKSNRPQDKIDVIRLKRILKKT